MKKPRILIRPITNVRYHSVSGQPRQYFDLKATCIDSLNLMLNNKGLEVVRIGAFIDNNGRGFKDLVNEEFKTKKL